MGYEAAADRIAKRIIAGSIARSFGEDVKYLSEQAVELAGMIKDRQEDVNKADAVKIKTLASSVLEMGKELKKTYNSYKAVLAKIDEVISDL